MRFELNGLGALAAVAAVIGFLVYNDLQRAPDMRRAFALEAAGHLSLAGRYTISFDCGGAAVPRKPYTAADAAKALVRTPVRRKNATLFFAKDDEDAIDFALGVRPHCDVARVVRHDRDHVGEMIRELSGSDIKRKRYRRTTIYSRAENRRSES